MNSERLVILIQQEIDGTNSKDESKTLFDYCSEHPDSQKLLDQYRSMARTFKKLSTSEPPDGLRNDILMSIRTGETRVQESANNFSEIWASLTSLRPAYVVSVSAALVVIIALVALETQFRASLGKSSVVGTIGAGPESPLTVDQSFDISAEGISGSAEFEHDPGKTLIDLTLHSAKDCEVTIDFDQTAIQFGSFIPPSGANATIRTLPGEVALTHRGDASYRISFTQNSAPRFPMAFQFFSAGNMVFEHSERLP